MAKFFDKSIFENLTQKVSSAAQTGVEKSRQLAEIAKLRASNIAEEEAIKKAYIEIGKLYYAERGDAPDGAYVALCSRISKAKDAIAQNHAQIEALKEKAEDDIQPEEDPFVPEDLADYMPQEEAAAEPEVMDVEAEPVEEVPAVEAEPVVEADPDVEA